MSKFVVEFSPPVKIKSKQDDNVNTVVNYTLVLAPFQKQTQIEFVNIKCKETAVRMLTVVNPVDRPGHFVLPPASDGVYFDIYEFTLQANSQRELSITWQPTVCGNMRKLIKIEQIDSNRRYDFVILGNCIDPQNKKLKSITYSKSKNKRLIKNEYDSGLKKIIIPRTGFANNYKSERICLEENSAKIPEFLESPLRRQTYSVDDKENVPDLRRKMFSQNNIYPISEHSFKRPDKNSQVQIFHNYFNIENVTDNCSLMSYDSLNETSPKIIRSNSPFNDFCLTPLKGTENLLSPFSTTKKLKSFNIIDENASASSFNTSPFEPIDASTAAKMFTPEERKPTRVSVNLCKKFEKTPKNKYTTVEDSKTFVKDAIDSKTFISPEQSFSIGKELEWTTHTPFNQTNIISSSIKLKRPSFAIKSSPYSKCSPRSTMISKNRLKQYSILSPRSKRTKTPKMDKCDQYLKCLANPELVYYNNCEDPFLKMSRYYEAEWLNRQEFDMIRWLNALLMPTDKLVDEDQSCDLEQAAVIWVEASKTSHKNKPMQLATQKDLFVAQIYRQSPQQWSALRKASSNLITSNSVATVLSKLAVLIEKDLITVRDDRQIHLDLNLKKKITDLLKCYNPLWFRIGLEAVYGQVIHIKSGSNDFDGIGWFIRKHLFNNDFIKQKFTKTTVLQVNLPSYNIAMKKFILKKILMLIFFLDHAKEQKLIRHNPCLFKIDSPYKSSYDFLMGFCADLVTSHGDIIRRLRSIDYNLIHKQTHLDEVNYAVKSLHDLRDGTRITRIVEILFKGDLLSHKLRLPAISKLQKIHNVNLALTRISEHINIEGNINTRDIVNGHREKMLSLFWQIIYKYLTPRYNIAATKIQHWWRNSSLKLFIMKKIRAKLTVKRNLAATKIQACVRGYLTRKQWPHIKPQLIENREKLHLASTTIKRYLQNKLKLLTEERKRFIILRRTVVFVQRKFRSNLAMERDQQQYKTVKNSILLIQKVFRGFIIRKNWLRIKNNLVSEKLKRINAVNIIIHTLRKNLPPTKDELYYKQLILTTLTIQRKFKANNLMKIQLEEFMTLKKSAIVIQQRFRAKRAMINQKNHYLKLKMCTLKLQAVTRGYIVRKQWPALRDKLQLNKMYLHTSSNTIKRALRRNLPLTQDRIKFIKLQSSVVILQRRFRATRDMKLQREQYLHLKTITLKLQSVARGYIVRKQWPELHNELQQNRTRLINCSNIIKRTLRNNLPLTEDRIIFLKLKKFTIIVQRQFRAMQNMKQQREKYLQLKTVVLKLQSVARGYILRRQWPSLQIEMMRNRQQLINCSNVIKRALRKNLPPTEDYLKFRELKKAVIIVQNRLRVNKQAKEYQILRKNVISIQRQFRAKMAMKQQKQIYDNTKTMTIKLQAYIRGYLVRKNWTKTKCELESNRKRLILASNTIKNFLRQCLPPTQDRLKYLRLKQSVINMQARYRAIVAMKLAEREYLLLKECVIILQRHYRAHSAMVAQKQQYKFLKKSTVLLQTHIRGYLARKRWPQLKNHLENCRKHKIDTLECKQLIIGHAFLYELNMKMRAATRLRNWTKNVMLNRKHLQKKNIAATKIQAVFKGYLVRKRLPQIIHELHMEKQVRAVTLIQALWRGYCVRKRYQCRRVTGRLKKGARTLGRRHNDVVDVLNKQKRNEYSYRELATVFWNLETCTSLSKELCLKTADGTEGMVIDYLYRFLLYSNQSQPSIEAREPAIRVLINLLKYHETSWHIWMKTVKSDMVKDLIKIMKTCCGKVCANKLYCTIATWLWIALQDPDKKFYIKNIPTAIVDLKFMMDTLNKKYKTQKVNKKTMVLPSTRPTWSIGSKCQKCFDSDLYATAQICKLLNI